MEANDILEKGFALLCVIAAAILLGITVKALTADHKVRYYYLTTYVTTGASTPRIIADIDWQADESIYLDRSITYQQAIQMVDSLNATLKH